MSYVPKYIIKRIIPKDAAANISLQGNGEIDGVGIEYVNILTAIEIPADADFEEWKNEFKYVSIDEEKYTDLSQLKLYFEGELIGIDEIEKIKGRTLPIGSKFVIFISITGGVSPGMHKFGISTQYKEQVNVNEVEREVPAEVKTIEEMLA